MARKGRRPPLSPVVFAERMRASVKSGELAFTAKADVEFVISQYEDGLINAINHIANADEHDCRSLAFRGLDWQEADALVLVETLEFASARCTFPEGEVHVDCSDGNSDEFVSICEDTMKASNFSLERPYWWDI